MSKLTTTERIVKKVADSVLDGYAERGMRYSHFEDYDIDYISHETGVDAKNVVQILRDIVAVA